MSSGAGQEPIEGVRYLGTVVQAEECERVGHDPTIGLRHDAARMAMVADCKRCGTVLMLDQEVRRG